MLDRILGRSVDEIPTTSLPELHMASLKHQYPDTSVRFSGVEADVALHVRHGFTK